MDSAVPLTHELRCLGVAAYLLPDGGAIAGRSAATLLGPGLAEVDDPVEIIVPGPTRPRMNEILTHVAVLDDRERCLVRGTPVTTPLRTCWDLSQWVNTTEAVVIVDRMLRSGLVTLAELAAYASRRRGHHGSRRFATVVGLADRRAESPQESRLRVALALGGLPKPEVQWEIRDDEGFIARVDLAYPEWRIAIEYDGLWHGATGQLHNDRERLNRLRRAEWQTVHVTGTRLRDDLPGLLNEITGALRNRPRHGTP